MSQSCVGYPLECRLLLKAQWSKVRIVTENTVPLFLHWLSYEAHRLGLYVVQCQGSFETILLSITPPHSPLLLSQKPPRDAVFSLRVEISLGYPPEAAQELQKNGQRLAKELLRHLGYSVPQRLRNSPLVVMAEKLRVADGQLASGEAYNIIDDIYEDDDLTQDQKRRKLVSSRRHKLHKRLIKQCEADF